MDDRSYLTPRELDFRRDECVTALGDGRYVVATESDGETVADDSTPDPATASTRDPATASETDPTAAESTRDSTATRDAESNYVVSLRVRTDEGEFDTRVEGDDVGDVAASVLRWYARRVAPEEDPARTLAILLSGTGLLTDPVPDR